MVFRRKLRARRSRSYAKAFTRKSRSRSSSGAGVKAIQFDAMLYGAGRSYLAQLISPLTSKIPFGGIADELGCGVIDYFVAKKSSGMIKDIAMKGLVIENARLGEAIVQGGLGSLTGQTGSGSAGAPSQGAFSW